MEESKSHKTFAHSEKGEGKNKLECQDTFCVMEDFYRRMTFLAVYDGHGPNGRHASDLANSSIRNYLLDNKETLASLDGEEGVKKFFKNMCSEIQDLYHKDELDYQLSGTCAIMVRVKDDMIYTGNLGDSRAVIARCSKDETCGLEVSIDHKPIRQGEIERMIASGGKIRRTAVGDEEVGPYRVWKAKDGVPGIAISRSLGDLMAHEIGVCAEPEVTAKKIHADDKFIVMGFDGVWDVMSSAEAVGFILHLPVTEKEIAAKKMVAECRKK